MTFFGKQMSDEEQKRRTMNSLAGVFERTTRILTGRPVKTKVVDEPSSPWAAWTIQPGGENIDCIYFNLDQIGDVKTAEDIVRVTGLNHHEAGHVWFTPPIQISSRNPIGAVLIDTGSNGQNAFNILEDQRIESMMVGMYPSIRHYYSAAIAGYLLTGSEADLTTAWMLVHGRKYLGSDLRDGLRQMFAAPEHADEVADIIDDFRVLDLYQHGHQIRGARLLRRFIELMYDKMDQQPTYSHSAVYQYVPASAADKANAEKASAKVRMGKDDRDDMKKDQNDEGEGGEGDDEKDENEKQSSGSKSKSKAKPDDDDDADEGDSSGDDDSDSEEDEEDESGSGSDGDDDSDDDNDDDWDEPWSNDDDDEAGDGADGDSNAEDGPPVPGGTSAGTGTTPVDRSQVIEQIAQAAAELLDEAFEDPQVIADIKRAQDAVKHAEHTDTIEKHRGWITETRADVAEAARKFGRRLDKIRTDRDPGWNRQQPQGRLNVQRAMHGDPLGDVWDVWEEGKTDTTDIEIVAAVDVSGSMCSHERALSDNTWIIKRSADFLQVPCTIYAFDHVAYLVYRANDKAVPGQFPNTPAVGGTQPSRVLVECARTLAASRRKKKLFIAMTDGVWGGGYHLRGQSDDTHNPDEIIAEMNGAGVLTAMVYLTGATDVYNASYIDWHNFQVKRTMKNLDGFSGFADELVRKLMKK